MGGLGLASRGDFLLDYGDTDTLAQAGSFPLAACGKRVQQSD